MELENNMQVWESNRVIDARYTKQDKSKGYTRTSFSLQVILQMATKQFGMFGKGWGYNIVDERMEEGVIIREKCTQENGDVWPEVREKLHTLLVSIWYVWDGEKIECPLQAGHTLFISRTKYGPVMDDEYYKKTLADALKKSFSMLGFGADIFLGMYDDVNYVKFMEEEKAFQNEMQKPEKIEALAQKVTALCESYNKIQFGNVLQARYAANRQEIARECRSLQLDDKHTAVYTDKLMTAYKAAIEELKSISNKTEGNK